MKGFLIGLFLMGLFGSSLLHAQTRSIGSLSSQEEKESVIYKNSYALIVGIDDYQDKSIRPLDYAVTDAEAISNLIQNFGFPEENITVLKNKEATRRNFIREFTELSEKTEKDDRILVYWAGHGETRPVGLGDEGYLLPYDTERDGLAYTALSMNRISELSRYPKAKHQLFLIDACYGGLAASTRSAGANSKSRDFMLDKMTLASARQIITAGGKDQQVVESPKWRHSAFTKSLLEALDEKKADFNGDALITANELFTFLSDRVVKLSISVGSNPHYPVKHRFDNAEGEFIFITDEFYNSDLATRSTNYMPDWYLKPPLDNEDSLYTAASAPTFKDAVITAFHSIAGKIESKVDALQKTFEEEPENGSEIITSEESSKITVNQQIADIEVSGLTKSYVSETSSEDETSYASVFSSNSKIVFRQNQDKYEAEYSYEEISDGENSNFNEWGEESWSNLRFQDLIEYIQSHKKIGFKSVMSRTEEGEETHFILLRISIDVARDELASVLQRDEELYTKFKESKAFAELQADRDNQYIGEENYDEELNANFKASKAYAELQKRLDELEPANTDTSSGDDLYIKFKQSKAYQELKNNLTDTTTSEAPPQPENSQKTISVNNTGIPDWYLKPERDSEKKMYVSGSGRNNKEALKQALTELTEQVENLISEANNDEFQQLVNQKISLISIKELDLDDKTKVIITNLVGGNTNKSTLSVSEFLTVLELSKNIEYRSELKSVNRELIQSVEIYVLIKGE